MKISISTLIFFAIIFLLDPLNLQAQEGIEYGENFIVFEAEASSSPLDKWKLRVPGDPEYLKYETFGSMDPIFQTYIEFTGAFGSADSPLQYTFTCPKTANYRMVMRMHCPLRNGEAPDQRNDVFVRLEGNYTSATSKPKSDLETNHKFYGRAPNKWGACHTLEIGSHAPAIYGLLEGEEYTFTMSGRSPGTCIDYIIFYENVPGLTISGEDLALTLPEDHRPGTIEPRQIWIDPDTTTLREGTSMQLNTLWEPASAKKDLSWTSSDDQVVVVDENGLITAAGSPGQTAIVTAASLVNDTSASCEVSIVEWYAIPIDSVAISYEKDTLATDLTIPLNAEIFPLNPDDPLLVWTSSDTLIAKVDSLGVLRTIAPGSVTIRVRANADASIYDELSFLIMEFIDPFVEFDNNDKYLGSSYKSGDSIEVTINYHAGTMQSVREPIKIMLREIKPGWQIEKEIFIADLDSYVGTTSGTIKIAIPLEGVKPSDQLPQGNFYFLFAKCFYTNGQEAEKGLYPIQIISAFPIESISISPETDTIFVDSTLALNTILYPENTDETSVIWTSSNSTIATVDQSGVVTALAPGNVEIAASSVASNWIFGNASIVVIEEEEEEESTLNDKFINSRNVVLYPNPSSSGSIGIRGLEPGLYTIKYFSLLGNELDQSILNVEQDAIFLDIDFLSIGMYVMVIEGYRSVFRSNFTIID